MASSGQENSKCAFEARSENRRRESERFLLLVVRKTLRLCIAWARSRDPKMMHPLIIRARYETCTQGVATPQSVLCDVPSGFGKY